MKRILILGASILQLPAIKKAKEMGLYVIVVDMNPKAVGKDYCDIFEVVSTLDKERVLEVSIKYNIDGIFTVASDRPLSTIAYVSDKLKIPGISRKAVENVTNKHCMRSVLKLNNVPIPEFASFTEFSQIPKNFLTSDIKYIVKPVDNSGSRGVSLIDFNDLELSKIAFNRGIKNSNQGRVIIEEFMEGNEVSVEAVTIDNETRVIAITDKITTGSPYFVEMGHSQPTQLSFKIVEDIIKITKQSLKALQINNSPSHTEIIITKNGPKIVEVGARLGGDNITTHLVPLSTNVDMLKISILLAIGTSPDNFVISKKGSAIKYFHCKKGIFKGVLNIPEAQEIEGIEEIHINKVFGENITNIESSNDRLGYVIASGDDVYHALKSCDEVISMLKFNVE